VDVPLTADKKVDWDEVPTQTIEVKTANVIDVKLNEEQVRAKRAPKLVIINSTIRVETWLNSIAAFASVLRTGTVELKLATKIRTDAETGVVDPDWSRVIGTIPKNHSPAAAADQLLA
jgi:hypothetical protein